MDRTEVRFFDDEPKKTVRALKHLVGKRMIGGIYWGMGYYSKDWNEGELRYDPGPDTNHGNIELHVSNGNVYSLYFTNSNLSVGCRSGKHPEVDTEELGDTVLPVFQVPIRDHLILKGLIGQTITRVQVEALPISEDCKVYFPCIVIHLNGGGKLYYMDIDEDLGFFYLNEEDVPREPEDLMPRDEHLYNVTEIDQISDFGLSQ